MRGRIYYAYVFWASSFGPLSLYTIRRLISYDAGGQFIPPPMIPATIRPSLRGAALTITTTELTMTTTATASYDVSRLRHDPPQSFNERNVLLFSELPRADYPHGVIRRYRKNAIVLNDEDAIHSLHFILTGRVKLYKSNQGGKDFILDIRGPDDYFGDLEFVDSGPSIASVVTLTESWMYIVQYACLEHFLSDHPEISHRFYRSVVQRSRPLIERINSLALDTVYRRVTRTLVDAATEQAGVFVIEGLTQQELADWVGACRRMVKLILETLKEGGYIKMDNKRITILKEFPRAW
jgi:CRP/FNR family transcriptional regulator, cyclic AMP receptor protein